MTTTRAATLPPRHAARPALRTVGQVPRSDFLGRAAQVGLDQDRAVVLEGLAPALMRLLNQLDGCHHRDDLAAQAVDAGSGAAHLDWVLRTLDQAGLLEAGGRARPLRQPGGRVRLVGAGPLGRSVAERLTEAPLDVLHVVDNESADQTLYPGSSVLGSQAEALRRHLGDASGSAVRVANHWSKPDGVRPELTIVASDRLECDRVVAEGLLRADQPHLLLCVRSGGVVVGPLVIPGQTACLTCIDLHRRDADNGWATLLPQLCRIRMPVVPALLAWAGGVTTAQALAWLSGSRPETCGATLEISPVDYITRWRAWPMHPACGCGWTSPAEW